MFHRVLPFAVVALALVVASPSALARGNARAGAVSKAERTGAASRPRAARDAGGRTALSAYAKQRARDGKGRFTTLRPADHAVDRNLVAEGTSSPGSPTRIHLRPATGASAGRLDATVDELYIGSNARLGGTTASRSVFVTDVRGKLHHLPATLTYGRYRSGYASARLQLGIPAGVTVSRAEVGRALEGVLRISSPFLRWQPAERATLRRLSN